MTLPILHGAIDDQRRPGGVRWVTGGAYLLVGRGEENWGGDGVLLTGA